MEGATANGNGTASAANGGCYACGPVSGGRSLSQCSNCGTTTVGGGTICPRCGSAMTHMS